MHLAPPEPLLHKCPDCEANEDEGVRNRKKLKLAPLPRKTHRLTYLRSLSEQWGTVVTFTLIEPPRGLGGVFLDPTIHTMRCPVSNAGPHALRVWGDGTYTVYPRRNGTPYVFTFERPPPRPRVPEEEGP